MSVHDVHPYILLYKNRLGCTTSTCYHADVILITQVMVAVHVKILCLAYCMWILKRMSKTSKQMCGSMLGSVCKSKQKQCKKTKLYRMNSLVVVIQKTKTRCGWL